ncbi:IS3 family transposase [Burkholderia contaminans]|uniref:IS3 family transposase n=1 Tax=Burkholderia contaminans TaxID=488447 RepID=UPI00158F4F03|nr:IS3 family transposase [Burkholderia contaminans]
MANQEHFPVRTLCRVLKLSASGFYAWRDRPPSPRALANLVLTEQIRIAHVDSRGTYGMPRIQAELRDRCIRAGRSRIGRLMKLAGLRGADLRSFVVTTERDGFCRNKEDRPRAGRTHIRYGGEKNRSWCARIRNAQFSSEHAVKRARKRKCPWIERAFVEAGQETYHGRRPD